MPGLLQFSILFFFSFFKILPGKAQFIVSGTVFDSSKINYVPDVRVISTGGLFAITDSMGRYSLMVNEKDSITFSYHNKPTQKYAVKTIPDLNHYDISLHVIYKGKYSFLKEVVVFSKSHRQDSIENRQTYADVFSYRKPGIQTSIAPGGGVGANVDELINIFRFRRNKRLRKFQLRLEQEEQEKYVSYRFNKNLVRRITHLQGEQLDTFLVQYRPDYDFLMNAGELQLDQYILNCSYNYKIELLRHDAGK